MKQLFLHRKIYSKWLILFVDLVIVISTLFLAFILTNGDSPLQIFNNKALLIGSYTLLSALVFILLKVNTRIIRYSNSEDILRVFLAVFTVSLVFACGYGIISFWLPLEVEGIAKTLTLNLFISSSLLVFIRIFVRSLYVSLKNGIEVTGDNILIYGSDHHALLIKRALDVDNAAQLNVIGFIDDDMYRLDKYIEQKKVFSLCSLHALREKYQIKKVLVSENSMQISNKIKVMEDCCEAGIQLIKVPSSEKWLCGKFDSDQLKDLNIDDLLGRETIQLDKKNILKELQGKRVLVTGAAGSIGSEIVRQALSYAPEMVILCDQAETPLHDLRLNLEDNLQADRTKVFIANIQNAERIRTLFELYRPEIVFHAAAYKHVPMMENNPSEAVLTNVLGTKNLADISIEFEVEKFVMISTDKAVKPTNVMGASKRLAEIYIQSLNSVSNYSTIKTRFVTTRFGNVLGSSGSVIPRFKSQINKRVPITVTHPDITRYFMTIPEAVELVLEAGAMGKGGEIFLFDMGEPIKIIDLAINMIKLAGLRPFVDLDIVYTGLRPGEKIYEELLLLEEKLIETHHPKIKISQNIAYNYFQINQVLNDLIALNKSGSDYDVVKKMKEILPDFISNNSKFEELDLLEAN